MKQPPCKHVSTAELSRITGYSEMHLSRLAHEGMPKEGRGLYDLERAIKWLLTRRDATATANIQDVKKQLIQEQIESQKLENAKSRGELLALEDVQHMLNAAGVIVASQLDGLAPRVAHELAAITQIPAPTVQEVVFRECRAIRESIATEWDAYPGPDAGGGDDHPASPEPQRRRVGRPRKIPTAGKPGAGQVA